ncbi:hypothetical protein KVT40_002032 [Elsinoe batatas]|uniref:Plastocyanin-like domain-containing protein n=1 Tax=Elsinoe batatas TaxID=2601811 RepID=A0A8K0LDV7_9PEZI|nr:hypothetical protein KVT40_002032 [Elsinoe batatas]
MAELQSLKRSDFWIRYETRERPTSITGYAILRYNFDGAAALRGDGSLPLTPPVGVPVTALDYLENSLQAQSSDMRRTFPKLSEVTRTVTIQMRQALTSGSYVNGAPNGSLIWAQNGLPWQEKKQAGLQQVTYLVQILTGGTGPNYTAALQNGGRDSLANAFPARIGEVLDIVWQNNAGPIGKFDVHPMHTHGEHIWDLGSGNGTYDAIANEARFVNGVVPAKRDTTYLYRSSNATGVNVDQGWRAWRIKITKRNVGAWMMHCHIAQHATMGMNTIWVFGTPKDIKKKFPSLPYTTGYTTYGGSAYGSEKKAPVVNAYFADANGDGEADA